MNEPLYPLLGISRLRVSTDGFGITTLVAGAGCPLRCRWCINQKTLLREPVANVTASDLLRRVSVDDLYFRSSGGGITFGGGEPLLHSAFIARFRELCPAQWRISIETSLAVPGELLDPVIGAADLFIVDCKDMDEEIYHRYTGGSAFLMKNNLDTLLRKVGPDHIIVRIPLIPDYNTKEDQSGSADLLHSMGVTKLDFFDYTVTQSMVCNLSDPTS